MVIHRKSVNSLITAPCRFRSGHNRSPPPGKLGIDLLGSLAVAATTSFIHAIVRPIGLARKRKAVHELKPLGRSNT